MDLQRWLAPNPRILKPSCVRGIAFQNTPPQLHGAVVVGVLCAAQRRVPNSPLNPGVGSNLIGISYDSSRALQHRRLGKVPPSSSVRVTAECSIHTHTHNTHCTHAQTHTDHFSPFHSRELGMIINFTAGIATAPSSSPRHRHHTATTPPPRSHAPIK